MNEWEFKASVIEAIGRLLTAALWPALVFVLVAGFSYPLWRLLARLSDLEEAEVAGQKVKFRNGVESANEAIDHAEENGPIVSPPSAEREATSRPKPGHEHLAGGAQTEQPKQPDQPVQAGEREPVEERNQDEKQEQLEERARDEKREQAFARLERALALRSSKSDYNEWLLRGLHPESIGWIPPTRREQRENALPFWSLTRREKRESRSSDAAFLILDEWAELERGVLRQASLLGLSFSRV